MTLGSNLKIIKTIWSPIYLSMLKIKNIELTEKKLITEHKNIEVKMVGYQLENEKIIEKINRACGDKKKRGGHHSYSKS